MPKVEYQDWGIISYQEAWDKQSAIQQGLIAQKRKNRELKKAGEFVPEQKHCLIFCAHPHVYTLGKSGKPENLLISKTEQEREGVEFFKINRGGDITYHGPGQIVGYPIFDLDDFFTDVHKYVRLLEEAVIQLLAHYGLEGMRIKDFTGVWLKPKKEGAPYRKICAIGVHLSRWVTLHGFALNVNTDLDYFNHIVPCGIDAQDKTVTSMAAELGKPLDVVAVKRELKNIFAKLFEFQYIEEASSDK